jgi:type 2A phosphatase activator TIP41
LLLDKPNAQFCNVYSIFFSFEDELQTTHLPEMVFGESFLSLQHTQTGIKLHFNAFDALKAWKKEALPPVEVPAAAKSKLSHPKFSILGCA